MSDIAALDAASIGAIFGPVVALLVGMLGYFGTRASRREQAWIKARIGTTDADDPDLVTRITVLVDELGDVRKQCKKCEEKVEVLHAKVRDLERQLRIARATIAGTATEP